MTDPRHDLGQRAEEAAAIWLASAGWSILARRHRSPSGGEVDIIGLDPSGVLVAVEVRARRTVRTGAASSTVDRRRITRLERTLVAFAATSGTRHRALRVDLVTAEPEASLNGSRWRLRRLPGIGSW